MIPAEGAGHIIPAYAIGLNGSILRTAVIIHTVIKGEEQPVFIIDPVIQFCVQVIKVEIEMVQACVQVIDPVQGGDPARKPGRNICFSG